MIVPTRRSGPAFMACPGGRGSHEQVAWFDCSILACHSHRHDASDVNAVVSAMDWSVRFRNAIARKDKLVLIGSFLPVASVCNCALPRKRQRSVANKDERRTWRPAGGVEKY